MALAQATLFINKIFQDKDFKAEFESVNCPHFDAVLAFANKHQFNFSKEEFIEAYKRNYKLRWMMYRGRIKV